MKLAGTKKSDDQFEAPLAFQSALAGILLASEVLVYTNGLREKHLPSSSYINVLTSLNKYQPIHFDLEKNETETCICGDEDFRSVYRKKWEI